MVEQTFKNIYNVLWKEAGCTTELDDLIDYVNNVVFPYGHGFKQLIATGDTIEYIASLNQFGSGPSPPTPLPERERGAGPCAKFI